MQLNYLRKEDLEQKAPAIFATSPHHQVSSKYEFFPTWNVIQDLEKLNWFPVRVRQGVTRSEENYGVAKHSVTFRSKNYLDLQVGEVIPEVVLTNSHDRSFSFQGSMGLFRVKCTNGLVVSESMFQSFSIKHKGYKFSVVEEMITKYVSSLPDVVEHISSYKKVILNQEKKSEFAKKALHLKYKNGLDMDSNLLLTPKREEDQKDDLWTVFNVVQENLFRGEISYANSNNRKCKTRSLESVQAHLILNQNLWGLMSSFVS